MEHFLNSVSFHFFSQMGTVISTLKGYGKDKVKSCVESAQPVV